MRTRLGAAILLLCGVCGAQVVVDQQVQVGRSGTEEAAKPKPSAEQLKRGHEMLERAEASALGMERGMRAYALLQVAHAYATEDKKKAIELLDDALAATKAMDANESESRDRLQTQILQAMVPLAPNRADELLPQIEPAARGPVLSSLLSYYQKNNDWDRAIAMVYRIAPDQEVPYDAVGRIMAALPEERSTDRQQLFATALNSYKNHPSQRGRMMFGGGDFSSLILTQWKKVSRESVLDGIHTVLEQTKQQAQSSNSGAPQPTSVSMVSGSGAVQFGSRYEFRLFQLLPVLKQVDPSEADKLVKESQAVQGMMDKYPDGFNSFGPPNSSVPGRGNPSPMGNMMSMSVGGPPSGGGGGRAGGAGLPSPMLMQQVAKIVQDAQKHPEDALANAGAIPDKQMRVQAFMGVAQVTAKANTSVTKQALEKALDGVGELDPAQQVNTVNSAANLYLEIEDTDAAKKTVEKGVKIADVVYKQDTNADDPNKALKAYWPSAEAYRSLLRVAAKISPAWAMELLKDVSDPEMKGMCQIALAQAWLDVSSGPRTIMTTNKNGTSMMQMRDQ